MRFGLLGTGQWAVHTQATALAEHPDVEFVGVWGRNPEKAAGIAARFGARGYAEVDRLLADVDAVAVALPPGIQADLAERAARQGLHLLLDKPLALDTAAADRVVEAVGAAGIASVIFFTNRFVDSVRAFLDTATSAGPWDGARITMFASIFGADSPYLDSQWRKDKGGLWDIGPHALSLLLPVLGPVAEVSAFEGPHRTTHVLMGHRTGAVSTMSLTLQAPVAAVASEFLFHGPEGYVEATRENVNAAQAYGTAIDELLERAASGRADHPCDVRFGREVVAVLAAAEQALDSRTVTRPESAAPDAGTGMAEAPVRAG